MFRRNYAGMVSFFLRFICVLWYLFLVVVGLAGNTSAVDCLEIFI